MSQTISGKTQASTPLVGSEPVPLVQGGTTKRASVQDLANVAIYANLSNATENANFTLSESHRSRVVEAAGELTVALPNSLPRGFVTVVTQAGAGQVTFEAASGATLRNRQSHTKTAGQWAVCSLYVRANGNGTQAEYVLSGDTAT